MVGNEGMKYKTKPVEIEAIQFKGKNGLEILHWMELNSAVREASNIDNVLIIKTLEGDMKASEGDYIIKGLKGEFYPCKTDIFHMKYEPI